MLYHMLYMYDPDFVELFKVKAEFDSTMERTEENIKDYAAFVCALCQKENLLQMDRGGVTKLVEHSSRLAEDQTKLSTRFAEISDIIREASYWATQDSAHCTNADHVVRAIEEKVHRSDLIREKIVEMIQTGKAPYPVERTQMASAVLDRCLDSKVSGHRRLETPELDIRYRAPRESQFSR